MKRARKQGTKGDDAPIRHKPNDDQLSAEANEYIEKKCMEVCRRRRRPGRVTELIGEATVEALQVLPLLTGLRKEHFSTPLYDAAERELDRAIDRAKEHLFRPTRITQYVADEDPGVPARKVRITPKGISLDGDRLAAKDETKSIIRAMDCNAILDKLAWIDARVARMLMEGHPKAEICRELRISEFKFGRIVSRLRLKLAALNENDASEARPT
jgi:hypothetical protein